MTECPNDNNPHATGNPTMRAQTRFELCDAHIGWKSLGWRRLADMFTSGGPSSGLACTPQPCRIRPGSDLFVDGVDGDELDRIADQWVRTWSVNQ